MSESNSNNPLADLLDDNLQDDEEDVDFVPDPKDEDDDDDFDEDDEDFNPDQEEEDDIQENSSSSSSSMVLQNEAVNDSKGSGDPIEANVPGDEDEDDEDEDDEDFDPEAMLEEDDNDEMNDDDGLLEDPWNATRVNDETIEKENGGMDSKSTNNEEEATTSGITTVDSTSTVDGSNHVEGNLGTVTSRSQKLVERVGAFDRRPIITEDFPAPQDEKLLTSNGGSLHSSTDQSKNEEELAKHKDQLRVTGSERNLSTNRFIFHDLVMNGDVNRVRRCLFPSQLQEEEEEKRRNENNPASITGNEIQEDKEMIQEQEENDPVVQRVQLLMSIADDADEHPMFKIDDRGIVPFHVAIFHRQFECFKLILDWILQLGERNSGLYLQYISRLLGDRCHNAPLLHLIVSIGAQKNTVSPARPKTSALEEQKGDATTNYNSTTSDEKKKEGEESGNKQQSSKVTINSADFALQCITYLCKIFDEGTFSDSSTVPPSSVFTASNPKTMFRRLLFNQFQSVDEFGRTALHLAASAGLGKIYGMLAQRYNETKVSDETTTTTMETMGDNGGLGTTSSSIDNGLGSLTDRWSAIPFMYACLHERADFVGKCFDKEKENWTEAMIPQSCRFKQDKWGRNILHYCAMGNAKSTYGLIQLLEYSDGTKAFSKDVIDQLLSTTDIFGRTPREELKESWQANWFDDNAEPLCGSCVSPSGEQSKKKTNAWTSPKIGLGDAPGLDNGKDCALITDDTCRFGHLTCVPCSMGRDTVEECPPENIDRLKCLLDPQNGTLRNPEMWKEGFKLKIMQSNKCSWADVLRVHSWMYCLKLMKLCASLPEQISHTPGLEYEQIMSDAIGAIDGDTAVSGESMDAALYAAGAVTQAVDLIMDKKNTSRRVFCAVRPPGHHAGPDGLVTNKHDHNGSHGFCLLNNVAIGAAYARHVYRDKLKRVAILDFDVHHGNGTQAILEQVRPRHVETSFKTPLGAGCLVEARWRPWLDHTDHSNIFFASVHGYGKKVQGYEDDPSVPWFYSSSGPTGVINSPKIINVGLPVNRKRSSIDWREAWRKSVLPQLVEFNPDMIFISAGFDGHKKDELNLGFVAIDEDDYEWLTERICSVANRCCNDRVVSVLEGGYQVGGHEVGAFGRSVALHVKQLQSRSVAKYYPEDFEKESEFENDEYERQKAERMERMQQKANEMRLRHLQWAQSLSRANNSEDESEAVRHFQLAQSLSRANNPEDELEEGLNTNYTNGDSHDKLEEQLQEVEDSSTLLNALETVNTENDQNLVSVPVPHDVIQVNNDGEDEPPFKKQRRSRGGRERKKIDYAALNAKLEMEEQQNN
eukprot:g2751.t1